MTFAHPEVLLLLPLVGLLLRRVRALPIGATPLRWSTEPWVRRAVRRALPLPRLLAAGGAGTLVLLAAGPERSFPTDRPPAESVAVTLVLDVSGSMTESGIRGSALDRARGAARQLVREVDGVRVGLVAFAGSAVTRLPPTSDTTLLFAALETAEVGVDENGSAIGAALGHAVERLRGVEASARAIVVVSDGRHNAGPVAPETAAELAIAAGIPVHALLPGTTLDDPAVSGMAALTARTGGRAVPVGGTDDLGASLRDLVPAAPSPGPPVRQAAPSGWWALPLTLLGLAAGLRSTRLGGAT